MSEKIKLFDFITEAIKACKLDIDIPEETKYFVYECPDGKTFSEDVKFSPETGKKISKVEYTREARYSNDDVSYIMRDFTYENHKDFGYEYIDNIEKRGDGSGYHDHIIFKRKSDGKHFYFYTYDGRMNDCNELKETKKVVIENWDFEKYFD